MIPRKRTPPRPRTDLAAVDADGDIDTLATQARYKQSDYHRDNRTGWRRDKTKCPEHVDVDTAEALLVDGIRRRMFSTQRRQTWPQRVWAVAEGVVYEAQLTNNGQGEYHGYPMRTGDRFADYLAAQWEVRG